jgi:hypothetical protein
VDQGRATGLQRPRRADPDHVLDLAGLRVDRLDRRQPGQVEAGVEPPPQRLRGDPAAQQGEPVECGRQACVGHRPGEGRAGRQGGPQPVAVRLPGEAAVVPPGQEDPDLLEELAHGGRPSRVLEGVVLLVQGAAREDVGAGREVGAARPADHQQGPGPRAMVDDQH